MKNFSRQMTVWQYIGTSNVQKGTQKERKKEHAFLVWKRNGAGTRSRFSDRDATGTRSWNLRNDQCTVVGPYRQRVTKILKPNMMGMVVGSNPDQTKRISFCSFYRKINQVNFLSSYFNDRLRNDQLFSYLLIEIVKFCLFYNKF